MGDLSQTLASSAQVLDLEQQSRLPVVELRYLVKLNDVGGLREREGVSHCSRRMISREALTKASTSPSAAALVMALRNLASLVEGKVTSVKKQHESGQCA